MCGEWFDPNVTQVCSRIRDIEGKPAGVGKLYCSDKCKSACSVYKKRLYYAGYNPRSCRNNTKLYTEYELSIWRKEVLRRADYVCEYCGELATNAHHIRPKKLEPFFALDPYYGLSCCEECHYKYGHKEECSTGNLAREVCI